MEKSDVFLSAGGAREGEEVCAWLCQPGEYKVGSHMVSFLGFLMFQICINGPLKEAQLLKTADNEKGGGERQASSK